eukprot:TRINITY_DN4041_c0_g1_i1.p1 TRINITY_DN4041_c0_g1~~TRINITY_DN4041_c0_g1_i1.p1  ORF type:complete len:183 (-),score=68.79 TRINITY_DN4041_c0_g1_i1:107-655(-)
MAQAAAAAHGVKLNASNDMKKAFQAARTEFKEFAISELKEYENLFSKYDSGQDGFIDLQELKYMLEQMGAPQTHLALKAMIKEVDEDNDNMISYREFLLIFRLSKTGKLVHDGLKKLASSCDVSKEGVGGAKSFFETKAAALNSDVAEKDKKYREDIKKQNEEKKVKKAAFKEKASMFEAPK